VIIAVVVLILILGIGGVLFMKYSKPPTASNTSSTGPSQEQEANSTSGTILSLLSGGKNVNCTISYPDNKGAGTIYVSDKKYAGDFTIKDVNGKEITSHMVSDGTYAYIWSTGMTNGIKMKYDAAKNTVEDAQENQTIDLNQNVNLKCSPWLPDNSKFTPPTNIKFQDISALLEQTQTTTGTQTQGSPCDQITDADTKAACIEAMSGQ